MGMSIEKDNWRMYCNEYFNKLLLNTQSKQKNNDQFQNWKYKIT